MTRNQKSILRKHDAGRITLVADVDEVMLRIILNFNEYLPIRFPLSSCRFCPLTWPSRVSLGNLIPFKSVELINTINAT